MELYDGEGYDEPDDEFEEAESGMVAEDTQMEDVKEIGSDSEPSDTNGKADNTHSSGGGSGTKGTPAQDGGSELKVGEYKSKYPVERDPALVHCASYDMVPTTAFLHGGPIYSMALSYGNKYLFTGGEDGYIRRYNFIESLSGKQLLSLGQRFPVDSIVQGGVITSYWENEQPLQEHEYNFHEDGSYMPQLSPVFSLAVQSECLWLCSGLKSGGITLQTIRYGEGQIQAYLEGHTSTVSDLILDGAETRLLSGSWDKTICYWDLETGSCIRTYTGIGGQVSSLAWQPLGGPFVSSDDDNKSMGSLFGSDEEAADPSKQDKSDEVNTGNTFLSSAMNGNVELWDLRSPTKCMLLSNIKAPPWCISACWSTDGAFAYAGRRNSTVDEFDIRVSSTPTRTLKFPSISGSVTCVQALPNGRNLLCASLDNIRLYDLKSASKRTPFYIIPGNHGAVISRMILDPTGRYFLTASGGRGWETGSSDVVLCYEISPLGEDNAEANEEANA